MIIPGTIYTNEQLKELGLERAREGFADMDIFKKEDRKYLMERRNGGIEWKLYQQLAPELVPSA
jgi:hypothetical protein